MPDNPTAVCASLERFVSQYGNDPKYRQAVALAKQLDQTVKRLAPQSYDSPGKQEARSVAKSAQKGGLSSDFASAGNKMAAALRKQ